MEALLASLKTIQTLKWINGLTPAEFWKEVGQNGKQKANDYDKLATGRWVPMLPTAEEFKRLAAASPQAADTRPNRLRQMTFDQGTLECRGGSLHFPAFRARDSIIRAKVKKVEGFHIDLRLRNEGGHRNSLCFNGGGFFCVGRQREGWKDLKTITLPDPYDDFFELAFAAVGKTLTVYVNGRLILETEDDLPDGAEVPSGMSGVSVAQRDGVALGLYKDIEVQILDDHVTDRLAAEWVFRVGGHAWGYVNGEHREITRADGTKDCRLTLNNINLDGSGIADADLANLDGLPGLKVLNLGHFFGTGKLTDGAVPYILNLKGLEDLSLWGTRLTDAGLERLSALTKLKVLIVSRTQVADEGLKSLAKLPDLAHLDLKFTRVTDAGMTHLTALGKLEALGLEATVVTDKGLQEIGRVKTLKHLDLNGTKVSDRGLVPLVKNLHQLTSLQVASTGVSDAVLLELKSRPNLEGLGLQHTQITDAGLEHLRDLKRLKWLNIKATKVTAEGVAKLAAALPQCEIVSDHKTLK